MTIEDAWDELDAFLTGEDMLPAPTGEIDQITLTGEVDATRAGRALARLRRDEDELAAVLAAERERIAAFEADRRAGIASARARLTAGLEAFMREEAARRGVTQIKLPTVTIRLAKNPDRIDGTAGAFLRKARPEIVRHKETWELDKNAAKKLCSPGPELVFREGAALIEWMGTDPVLTTPDFDAALAETSVHQAVDKDGEIVLGVVFFVPRGKEFRWELRAETEAEPLEVES